MFTREQLVTEAYSHGFEGALDRTFKVYVGAGLLARAHSPGRGRGHGRTTGTWNDAQRRLWLDLLLGRKNGYSVRELTNAVVWMWFTGGDDAVPIAQVRKALGTWVGPRGKWGTRAGARDVAKRALAEVDNPNARPIERQRLRKIVEDAAWCGKVDRDQLRDVAHTINKRAQRPPEQAQFLFDPDQLADLFDTRIKILTQLDTIPDEWFHRARTLNTRGLQWYQTTVAQAASDPHLARHTPPIDWVERSSDSCNTLLTYFGLIFQSTEQPMPMLDHLTKPLNDQDAPATTGMARGHGTGTQEVPDATPP